MSNMPPHLLQRRRVRPPRNKRAWHPGQQAILAETPERSSLWVYKMTSWASTKTRCFRQRPWLCLWRQHTLWGHMWYQGTERRQIRHCSMSWRPGCPEAFQIFCFLAAAFRISSARHFQLCVLLSAKVFIFSGGPRVAATDLPHNSCTRRNLSEANGGPNHSAVQR